MEIIAGSRYPEKQPIPLSQSGQAGCAQKFVAVSTSCTRAGTLERLNWIDEKLTATEVAPGHLGIAARLIQNLLTDFDDRPHTLRRRE